MKWGSFKYHSPCFLESFSPIDNVVFSSFPSRLSVYFIRLTMMKSELVNPNMPFPKHVISLSLFHSVWPWCKANWPTQTCHWNFEVHAGGHPPGCPHRAGLKITNWGLSVAKPCKSCRSRQKPSNEYWLAKIGFRRILVARGGPNVLACLLACFDTAGIDATPRTTRSKFAANFI